MDGDVTYLVGDDGALALLPTGSTSEIPVSPASLLDVRSRIRVFQKGPDTIQVVQSAFNAVFEIPGATARTWRRTATPWPPAATTATCSSTTPGAASSPTAGSAAGRRCSR